MKPFFALLLSLFLCQTISAQQSKVFDDLTVKSNLLNADRKYAIYLPADYETAGRAYPVLYLLHGSGDNQTGWVQFGEVQRIADKAIADGTATPMIIVMPDADTQHRGYFNHPSGKFDYERFFFEELIPHIEKTYRCKTDKSYRAVAGLSMGGGGTLVYALHHPELFAAACPLSAAVRKNTGEFVASRYAKEVPGKTEQELKEWYKNYDILDLVANWPEENQTAVRWYIDCGDGDFLAEGNALLHIAMHNKKIPHEYRVRNGEHNWTYWREALPEVLGFVTVSFQK